MLRPLGLVRATTSCAALFGLFHLLRFFLGGQLISVAMQIVHATAVGFAYGAFRWRTNTIWPLILTHALHNALLPLNTTKMAPKETEIVFFTVIVDGFLAAYGYRLLQLENRERSTAIQN